MSGLPRKKYTPKRASIVNTRSHTSCCYATYDVLLLFAGLLLVCRQAESRYRRNFCKNCSVRTHKLLVLYRAQDSMNARKLSFVCAGCRIARPDPECLEFLLRTHKYFSSHKMSVRTTTRRKSIPRLYRHLPKDY